MDGNIIDVRPEATAQIEAALQDVQRAQERLQTILAAVQAATGAPVEYRYNIEIGAFVEPPAEADNANTND